MGVLRNRPYLTAFLLFFTLTGYYYHYYTTTTTTTTSFATMATTADLSHLTVTAAQKPSATPPTLTLTVKNTHPSHHLTLLTWESPLDPLALQLGAIAVYPAANGAAPLALATIKVNRKLPPVAAEALVSLAPGESRAQDVVLREPVVSLGEVRERAGGKARVVCKGRWKAVWVASEGEVGAEALGKMEADEGAVGGEWEAEAVEVEV